MKDISGRQESPFISVTLDKNNLFSQIIDNPRDPHMKVVFHILWNLKSAKGLLFSKHDHLQIKLLQMWIRLDLR